MRSPVLAFSLFAAATLTSAASGLPKAAQSFSESPAGAMHTQQLVDEISTSPQHQNQFPRDDYSYLVQRPPPRVIPDRVQPPRPARPTRPQGSDNACDGSSTDDDVTGGNGLSGGTSCTANAVGMPAGGSTTPTDVSDFNMPGAVDALDTGSVSDAIDTPAKGSSASPYDLDTSTNPYTAARYAVQSKKTFSSAFRSAFSQRARRQNSASQLVASPGNSPVGAPEDITSFDDAVGAGGTTEKGILGVGTDGGGSTDGDDSTDGDGTTDGDGSDPGRIQGAAIPGISNGQYPGGEAHPGTPGPSGPGSVSNQGTEVNNDAAAAESGARGVSDAARPLGGAKDRVSSI